VKRAEFKQTLYNIFEDTGKERTAARAVRQFLVFLIVINVALSVVETVPKIQESFNGPLKAFQLISGQIFLIEYVLRLYVADLHPPLRRYGPIFARLRYAIHIDAIVDLIAVLPLLLVLFETNTAVTTLVILRLLRFLKLARYSPALRSLLSAVASERQALMGSTVIIFGVVLLAATMLYLVEHDIQPEKLSSIPEAMWWALATVTTVGYGDVVPVTDLGKVIGGVVMLMGYGLIALPVGIIASAFAREIHSRDFVVTWSMVARVPLFEDLKATQIAEVAKLLKAQKVRAGTVIAQRGDVADKMYFISDGDVEIQLETKTVYLGEGEFFGELALIHQRQRETTVTAYHDCDLLVLEAMALQQLMDRHPSLAARILEEAEQRAKEGRRVVGDLAEEELEMADVYPTDEAEAASEPELFQDEKKASENER
jgi:voltage-gated potassium channel